MSLISLVTPLLHNVVTRLMRYEVRDKYIVPVIPGRASQSVLLILLPFERLLHCRATISLSSQWQRLVMVNKATKGLASTFEYQ